MLAARALSVVMLVTWGFQPSSQASLQVAILTIDPSGIRFTSPADAIKISDCKLLVNGSETIHSVAGRHIKANINGRRKVDFFDSVAIAQPVIDVQNDALMLLVAAPDGATFDASSATSLSLRLALIGEKTGASTTPAMTTVVMRKDAVTANGVGDVSRRELEIPLVSTGSSPKQIGVLRVSIVFVIGVDSKRWPPRSVESSRPNRVYEFGHRGCGNSHELSTKENVTNSFVPENTVAALKYASKFSDFIEFDVQVSDQDRVPFLSHDFVAATMTVTTATAGETATSCLNSEVASCSKAVLCDQTQAAKTTMVGHRVVDFTQAALQSSCVVHAKTADVPYAPADPVPEDFTATADELRVFPSLQTVLDTIDPAIGINIEFKYPLLRKDGSSSIVGYMDRNEYVDAILDVLIRDAVQSEALGKTPRRVVIGSFDPDICLLMHLKQSRFPVVIIGPSATAVDWRVDNLPSNVAFAAAANLEGVMLDSLQMPSYDLVSLTDLVTFIKSYRLFVWTWGRSSNDGASRHVQIDSGIDGICMDRIYKIKSTPIPADSAAVNTAFHYSLAIFCLIVAFGLQHSRSLATFGSAVS